MDLDPNSTIVLNSITAVVSVAGLAGNIFCAVILMMMERKRIGGVRLLRYLAYSDIAILCGFLVSLVARLINKGLDYLGFALLLFNRSIYTFETYLTVLISLQRCVALKFPFKFGVYLSESRINKILLTMCVLSPVIPIPACIMHYWRTRWNPGLNSSAASDHDRNLTSSEAESYYNRIVLETFYLYIPLVALVVCNITLVVLRHQVGTDVQNINNKGPGQLTAAVLVMTILSLITHASNFVSTSCCPSNLDHFSDTSCLPKLIMHLLLAINCSANFICFCCIGRAFRHHLQQLVCKKSPPYSSRTGSTCVSSVELTER